MLRFYRWISDYYIHPLGEVIKTGLPPGLHLKSELILSLTQEGRDLLLQGIPDPLQEKVFKEIDRCGKAPLKRVVKTILRRSLQTPDSGMEEKRPTQTSMPE